MNVESSGDLGCTGRAVLSHFMSFFFFFLLVLNVLECFSVVWKNAAMLYPEMFCRHSPTLHRTE